MIHDPGIGQAGRATRSGARTRAIAWAGIATVLFLVALAVRTDLAATLFRAWALAVGTIGLALLVAILLREVPAEPLPRRRLLPLLRRLRRPPGRPREVPQLTEMERIVAFATSNAFDVHFRLRPRLVLIADYRLARHGLSLAGPPARLQPLLGDDAWDLVRPDRPVPENRNGPGISRAAITRAVEALDAL
ncbi:MAG: hypothetical protein WAM30_01585 [Candidatus Dormiibacterota bacterium]